MPTLFKSVCYIHVAFKKGEDEFFVGFGAGVANIFYAPESELNRVSIKNKNGQTGVNESEGMRKRDSECRLSRYCTLTNRRLPALTAITTPGGIAICVAPAHGAGCAEKTRRPQCALVLAVDRNVARREELHDEGHLAARGP
jgi:hypothetical protein